MIRIDLTTATVIVEGDGSLDHFVTVRTIQTEGSASRVARIDRVVHDRVAEALTETARSRQGRHVMREYDIDAPGTYALTSGRRELEQNRTFYVDIGFLNNEEMEVTVVPPSPPCAWVVNEELHNYVENETFRFVVRVTQLGMATGEGEVTRMSSDKTGVTFERTTAWERLMNDEDPNSV